MSDLGCGVLFDDGADGQRAGAGQGGQREPEGEAGGRFAAVPERDGGHDAHPGAGEAGQRGEGLGDADRGGAGDGQRRQRLFGAAAGAPLGERDQRGGDEQEGGGDGRSAQVGLDRLVERRADDRERDGGDEAERDQAARGEAVDARRARGLLCAEPQAAQHGDDFAAERPDDGEQCAGVDGDIEGEARVLPAEQPARQREVAAAADRQKFGDALHQREHDDFED